MPRFIQRFFLLFPALVVFQVSPVSAVMHHFKEWYPEWGFIFNNITHVNCADQYRYYRDGETNLTQSQWYNNFRWIGSGTSDVLAVPLVDCILNNSAEYMKSEMSAANVVLGLTPSILASLGSSADETSILSAIGNRPFLALCLSAGSPAVEPLRLFQHRKLTTVLDDHPGRLKVRFFPFWVEVIIVAIEHLAVLGAIANVAMLGYQLGSRVVLVFAPHLTYLIFVWIFLGVTPYLFARFALHLRIKFDYVESQNPISWLKRWIAPWNQRRSAIFTIYPETLLSTFFSAMVSLIISAHIIFGTLVFSSMLFISVKDTMPIVGRFLISAIVCRIVLVFELARIRHLFHKEKIYELIEQIDEEIEKRDRRGNSITYLRLFRRRTNSGISEVP
jgi:hypothetical protein